MGILEGLFVLALVVIPLWRIFERTGRSGAWSLLAIVPGFGAALAALLWGYGPWPRFEHGAGAPGMPGAAPPAHRTPPGPPSA
ncbi:MAG: hypothetical protein RIB84_25820 [Sneathiellaceae bacterium]